DCVSVADVAVNEPVPGMVFETGQVLQVAGVRQLVQVEDVVAGVVAQDVAYEVGADEPGPSRDQKTHDGSPFSGCRGMGAFKIGYCVSTALAASFCALCATRLLASRSDSKVPASVHHPERMSNCISPARMYALLTSVISSSPRREGLRVRMMSKTLASYM